MLLDSLKLKAPSSIYFLGLAKNPQDRTTMVSLDTTPQKPVWKLSPFGSPLFHENAMGPMYHIDIVFILTWKQPLL